MKTCRVSPAARQLMHPIGWRRQAVDPLAATRIEQVDVPGYRALTAQTLRDGLSCSLLRIVEVTNARVIDDSGRWSGRLPRVIREHVDPDDAHTDVGAWEVVDNRSSYRPGTVQTERSGGRQQGEKPTLALAAVEVILERLQ